MPDQPRSACGAGSLLGVELSVEGADVLSVEEFGVVGDDEFVVVELEGVDDIDGVVILLLVLPVLLGATA